MTKIIHSIHPKTSSILQEFPLIFLVRAWPTRADEEKKNLDVGVLAEVVDQTISLIQTLQEPGEIQQLDIIALNSLAGAFTNVPLDVVMESHFFVERS